MSILLVQGNTLSIPLADKSVQCIVTSPPYWGLRSYAGTAKWEGGSEECDHEAARHKNRFDYPLDKGTLSASGGVGDQSSNAGSAFSRYDSVCPTCGARRHDAQLGSEPLHDCLGWATGNNCGECYICHMRQVARECWRVLRDDGVMFWNIADSYASGGNGPGSEHYQSDCIGLATGTARALPAKKAPPGLKPKDKCGIPERTALAFQTDGWWWRSDIVWHKPNPMPESVTDRPTKSHEFIYLFTKAERYYWDSLAVSEISGSATSTTLGRSALAPELGTTRNTNNGSLNLRGKLDFSESEITIDGSMTIDTKNLEVIGSIGFSIIGEVSERDFVMDLEPAISAADFANTIGPLNGRGLNDFPVRATIVDASPSIRRVILSDLVDTIPPAGARATTEPMAYSVWPPLRNVTFKDSSTKLTFDFLGSKISFSVLATLRPSHADNYKPHPNNTQSSRNLRDVWTMSTQAYPGAHFATYPSELPRRCIKAATSERGACPKCGKPWERVVSAEGGTIGKSWHDHADDIGMGASQNLPGSPRATLFHTYRRVDKGWRAACTCDAGEPVPCIVFDPFSGAATTGLVARELNRHYIGLELSAEYLKQSRDRLSLTALDEWGGNGRKHDADLSDLPMFKV